MKKIGIGMVVITISLLGLIVQNVIASKVVDKNQVEISVEDQNLPVAQNTYMD